MWNFSLQESSPELLNFEMSLTAHCLYILKTSVINACFAHRFLKHLKYTFINLTQFLQHVGNICCLHQRTPLKRVQSLKLQRCRYVPMGFNRAHLIVLTISVITTDQLNVKSWLLMLLRFISIECDFVSKQWMDLIALNKGLIAQSKEVISL